MEADEVQAMPEPLAGSGGFATGPEPRLDGSHRPADLIRMFAAVYAIFLAALLALVRGRRRLAMGLTMAGLLAALAVFRWYMTDPLPLSF